MKTHLRHLLAIITVAFIIAFVVLAFWDRGQLPDSTPDQSAETAGEREIDSRNTKAIPNWVFEIGDYEPGFVGDLREPLDENELRYLADNPKEDRFRLKILICRAAAERDSRFRYLLDQEGLREDPWIDLPLAAYDYSVNGSEDALNYLLTKHAEQRPGSDCDTVLVLSFVDEWQRSIPAVLNHFNQGGVDGAAGIGYSEFWITRKQLFPKQFDRNLHEAEQGAAEQPATAG